MPAFTFLEPPVPGTTIADPGELSALVDQAQPSDYIGFIWYSDTAPDVITYPVLKRLVWIDLSSTPIAKRHWNEDMSSWEVEELQDGSVDTAHLADAAVTLAKISTAGGSAGAVLRINGGGSAIIWDSPQNLFTTSSRLSVTVLSLSAGAGYVLTSNGSTNSWATFSSLGAGLTIALSQLSTSGASTGEVLGYTGSAAAWGALATFLQDGEIVNTKIAPGSANTFLTTNVGGTATQWRTATEVYNMLAAYFVAGNYTTSEVNYTAVPAAGDAQAFAHGLNSTPIQFGAFIVCIDPGGDGTFSEGDSIPWDHLYDNAADEQVYFTVIADGTNITAARPNNGGGVMFTTAKDGSAHNASIDAAKWELGAWAIL